MTKPTYPNVRCDNHPDAPRFVVCEHFWIAPVGCQIRAVPSKKDLGVIACDECLAKGARVEGRLQLWCAACVDERLDARRRASVEQDFLELTRLWAELGAAMIGRAFGGEVDREVRALRGLARLICRRLEELADSDHDFGGEVWPELEQLRESAVQTSAPASGEVR